MASIINCYALITYFELKIFIQSNEYNCQQFYLCQCQMIKLMYIMYTLTHVLYTTRYDSICISTVS